MGLKGPQGTGKSGRGTGHSWLGGNNPLKKRAHDLKTKRLCNYTLPDFFFYLQLLSTWVFI